MFMTAGFMPGLRLEMRRNIRGIEDAEQNAAAKDADAVAARRSSIMQPHACDDIDAIRLSASV
jgi:hypothetical protein